MIEVELGGQRYRTGRLDAFKQFHLFRKLMPILSGLGETSAQQELLTAEASEASFWGSLGPVATSIAEMSQQDSEFILKTCLNVVQVWNGQTWVRVTSSTGDLMFEDIGMMEMLRLSFEVIKDNLSGFFSGPRPNGSAAGDQPSFLSG